MANIVEAIRENAADEYEAQKIVALARAYFKTHGEWLKEVRLVKVEKHLETKLVNFDTNRKSRKYRLHGYLDKLLWHPREGLLIVDHKTTSEDIANPNNRYFQRLISDPQSTAYLLLCMTNYIDVSGVLWDIVKKPAIKPKQLTQKDSAELEKENPETVDALAPKTGESFANGQDKRMEGPELFGGRVYEWATNPNNTVFLHHRICRTDADVYDLNQSTWALTRMLQWCEKNRTWPMNLRSCFVYSRLCEYHDVCHGCTSLESPEFEDADKDPARLSHSSMGDFFSCPRKFKYRYIDKRVPMQVVDDNLRVGTLWHQAMDLMFQMYVQPYEKEVVA